MFGRWFCSCAVKRRTLGLGLDCFSAVFVSPHGVPAPSSQDIMSGFASSSVHVTGFMAIWRALCWTIASLFSFQFVEEPGMSFLAQQFG